MANVISKIIKNGTEYQIYGSGGAAGAGDVTGPSSSTNGHLAVFDGTTGKKIKDGGAVPTGTITGINMNGASKGTSGVVDLGTVITAHQNIKTVNNNTITGTGNVSVGTITGITMNSTSKGTSGVVDLGTVITSHQSIKTVNNQSLVGTGNVSVGTLTAETVVSGDSGTTYTIKVSSSEPGSGTPATTITFVTA